MWHWTRRLSQTKAILVWTDKTKEYDVGWMCDGELTSIIVVDEVDNSETGEASIQVSSGQHTPSILDIYPFLFHSFNFRFPFQK
jgi:hypothetical protein